MGNIDEKRLSALLERIITIKEDLESLENEVRNISTDSETASAAEPTVVTEPVTVAGPSAPVTEPAEVTEPLETDIPTYEPAEAEEASAEEPIDDTPIDIDLPAIDIPQVIEDPAAAYDQSAAAATAPTQKNDDLPLDITEAESKQAAEAIGDVKPKAAIIDSTKAETAVMDVMAEKQAWRTDRPGSQVKNVISAISLNDRVLLINVLFREDPILFQNTISAFNGMSSLDEAITYIQANFPEWDMNSEPVYRLMMAVRRKLS